MARNVKKYFWIVPLGLISISFLFFQFFYSYHLFLKEQIQLFLYTSDYFLSYFNKPAWLACYSGDFLTQFFYLRGGGAIVLSILFGIEWLLSTVVIKRISPIANASVWALLPVFADCIFHCDILYSISVSVGFIFMLALFLIYTSISNKWLSLTLAVILTFVGYWLLGNSILVFPFLVVAHDLKNRQRSLMKWLFLLTIVISLPLILRHHYLLTNIQAYIFPAFNIQSLLLQGAFVLALVCSFLLKNLENKYSRITNIVLPSIFIFLLIAGIMSRANFRFEKILSLDSETYFGHPDRVIELSQKYDLKDRRATYFTNMALTKKGILPDSLLNYYQPASYGLILPVTPDENWQSIFMSNEVFFLLGDMNLAQHSAMLGNTFSPYQRSSRMIRRLAEINLINGDSAAAGKYLRILGKTLFHKKWAEKLQAINHSSISDNWLSEKRAQIPNDDMLRMPNDYLASLNFLVEQNPENLIALDYLLCFHLLSKDLKSFRKIYDQYGRKIKRAVPSVYSEALLIQLLTLHATQEEVLSYAIYPQKVKDFSAYTQLYEQTKGDMNALKERFGKSYWFYYHFATIQKK